MTTQSKIEWTGPTLNTVAGCTPQGPECDNCYADDEVHRFARSYVDRPGLVQIRGPAKKPGLTWLPTDKDGNSLRKGAKWTGRMACLPHKMLEPIGEREPDLWFVNSVSDLFHKTLVDDEYGLRFIAANFGLFGVTPHHTYQALTKQPEAAARALREITTRAADVGQSPVEYCVVELIRELGRAASQCECGGDTKWMKWLLRAASNVEDRWRMRGWPPRAVSKRLVNHHIDRIVDIWPLPNVQIGVSVGIAKSKRRLQQLREIPAELRFVSFEPLLEDLGELDLAGIDWAIVGGESGAKARPCELDWLSSVVRQAQSQSVPVFVKQLGRRPKHGPGGLLRWPITDVKGAIMSEWPEHLRVREMPEVARG